MAIQKVNWMVLATLSRRFGSVTWDTDNVLGRGQFGICYAGMLAARSGTRPSTSWPEMEVGVKVLYSPRSGQQDGYDTMLMREVEVMANSHPALLGLIAWGAKDSSFCLVTRRMQTDLEHLLSGASGPEWNATTRSITALGIAAGMCHLHSKDIIHRDLKPANVLMAKDFRPRVADFGLARNMPVGDQLEMTFDVGTPLYMAPELIRGEAYGLSVDVYAWSFIFWRLITGNKLFSDIPPRSLLGLRDYVLAGGRPKLNDVRDPAQKRLLELCWNQNPLLRPTFREILQDPSKLIICECNVAEFNAYRDEILNAS